MQEKGATQPSSSPDPRQNGKASPGRGHRRPFVADMGEGLAILVR